MRIIKVLFFIVNCQLSIVNLTNAQPLVNTLIGTANSNTTSAGRFGKGSEEHGHTLPAVLEPHGMTFWTPQTRATEQKCICPYYYNDTRLQGFRASHWIVGGCTQDYGSFTLMPLPSKKRLEAEQRATPFKHTEETATPAYYSVSLPYVQCEMTGRSRSAIFRFSFKNKKKAYLVFEANSDEGEGTIEYDAQQAQVHATNPVHRIYQGWGESAGMTGYAILQLRPEDVVEWGKEGNLLWIRLNRTDVLAKVATSFTGIDGAQRNLESEIPHWDFDKTRQELEQIWEKQFGKINPLSFSLPIGRIIEVEKSPFMGGFRGAIYHASFLPHVISDVDGRYPGFAGTGIKQMEIGRHYYDDFSAWDTYRAQHPLLNIISPRESADMMQSLVLKYQQGGWLPIFPCWNSYTSAMIGDHCAAILAEAYKKGIRHFDYEMAYEAMRKNAFTGLTSHHSSFDFSPLTLDLYKDGMGRRALDSYLQYGYIPLEDSVPDAFHQREQVSRTMEYAYDDYAVAEMARLLGHVEDYRQLTLRSHNWANVINPQTGWCDGRYRMAKEGHEFVNSSPLGGIEEGSRPTFITEGWPCHYTWYVPHDVEGLIQQMGGRKRFVARLDSMFTEGLYWHGNEPCHQVAYLFDYAGEPWRTQRWVRHILNTEYNNSPGGLSGNDDAGQMSAWYIFSCLGFYPVCPVSGEYAIGSPVFPEVEIPLENGKVFRIIAHNASDENIYIQSAKINNSPMESPFFTHDDILAGSTLEFEMGPKPSAWGCTETAIFNPLDFGAVGDGIHDDTQALQACINAASNDQWSMVNDQCSIHFPSGKTFLVGPLELKGDIDYHFEAGSRLLANPDESIYHLSAFGDNRGEGMLWLWANGADNISFSGQGIIDGNGIAFMGPELEDSYVLKDLKDPKFDPRPHVLTLFGCRNIEISGITVQNGAYWTIHLVGCDGAKIHDMSLLNQLKIRNGDGIDLDHTSNVEIWNCLIESGDDCICLKNRREYSEGYLDAFSYLQTNNSELSTFNSQLSTLNSQLGQRAMPLTMRSTKTQHIRVRDCVMTGRSCTIKIGSENMDSISDVVFDRCVIRASNRGLGIQNRDEGTVTDVTFQNMTVESWLFSDVWWGKAEPIYVTSYPRAVGNHKDAGWRFPKGAKEGKCGEVSNITFRNIEGISENGCFVGGDVPGKVQGIRFDNVTLTLRRATQHPLGIYDRRPCLGEGFVRGLTYGLVTENTDVQTRRFEVIPDDSFPEDHYGGEIK